VANLLAQLENMPRLLSAHTVSHQTYFAGSLLAEGNDEDAPVGLDALLLIKGRPRRTAKMRRLYYLAVLRRAALAQDKDRLRVEAALDHLAARFNERFANGALRRFAGLRPTEAVAARTDRIKSKRDFVNSYAELSAYRASTASPRKSTSSDVGPDVFQGKEALAKKIKLLTGLANAPLIVEHVLLRGVSAFDPITQDNSNAALAVRFGAGSSKTLLLGERKRHKKRVRLEEYLLETTKRLRFEAATSDRVRLFFLGADNSVQAEILQPFSSVTQARAFAKNLKDVLQNTDSNQGSKKSLKKLECVSVLPNDFFKNRISVFFEFANINTLDPLFQGFVERTLKDNLPSHIAAECYWTEPSDLKPLKKKLDLFRSSLSQSASGDEQLSREICSDLSLRFHTKRTASWAT
ncbi:MAG: hypothetical protein QNJ09_12040, partial [Paracoccaceae bacterium]|nr:hypothetical protein [Paracoccaceae bacterium]